MPSAAVSYVIYVTVMIGISAAVIFFFMSYSNMLTRDLIEPHMNEVANYICENILKVYTLINTSDSNMIVKELNIPSNIMNKGYFIEIVELGEVKYLVLRLKVEPWTEIYKRIPLQGDIASIDYIDGESFSYGNGWRAYQQHRVDSGYAGLTNYRILVFARRENGRIILGLAWAEKT